MQILDFSKEYILYNSYGPYYVGLANADDEKRGLGDRLKEHTTDPHQNNWDRFSWFGFKKVYSSKKTTEGILSIQEKIPNAKIDCPSDSIRNVEALLIRAMGCSGNNREMNFTAEQKWEQIELHERNYYVSKLK